ncbi:MAG: hypothetical protein P8H21_02365 [Woeseiaceae bacterium]|nr:hypothetical protein [Woeseiaceae bacterium]MDG1865486.1 hypothetical protein [Woeseiaceae bacterium]
MARLAAARSTINWSSCTTRPTVGMSLIANVPTLNGADDFTAWAEPLTGIMKSASIANGIRLKRDFLVIFSLQCNAL